MPHDPTCSLCSGRLVREKNVAVPLGILGFINYSQARVCAQCSAVFPIAMWQQTASSDFEPLYTDGKRIVEGSP
jgi:hypothetical protein